MLCDPATLATVAVANLDWSGVLQVPVPISVHLPGGSLVVFQALVMDGQGRIQTSLASQRTVR